MKPVTGDRGRSRGKGSHEVHILCDSSSTELARFGVTGHPSKDMSWKMLREVEETLAPWFGEKWTEKR